MPAASLLALVLIAATVLLALSLVDPSTAVRPSGIWVTVAILAAFAAVEFSVFRFTFRRESLAFSLSEIPLAFSLVYLGLWPAIAVRIVGVMSMIMLVRRPPPYKAALNVGMFAFEMCLAFVVFRGIVDLADTGNTVMVVAAIAATAICGVVSSMIVSIAISRFEGGLWQRIGSELTSSREQIGALKASLTEALANPDTGGAAAEVGGYAAFCDDSGNLTLTTSRATFVTGKHGDKRVDVEVPGLFNAIDQGVAGISESDAAAIRKFRHHLGECSVLAKVGLHSTPHQQIADLKRSAKAAPAPVRAAFTKLAEGCEKNFGAFIRGRAATFAGCTLSGAAKVRALDIID